MSPVFTGLHGARTSRPAAGRRLASLLLACSMMLLVLAGATSAFAAASWLGEYPVGLVHMQPSLVGASVFSSVSIRTGSQTLKIDGVAYKALLTAVGSATGHWSYTETLVNGAWVGRWVWVSDPADATRATVYSYPLYAAPLGDGAHAVAASVKDTRGALWTHNWTFTLSVAPVLGAPFPAAGSIVATTTPQILVPVTDNDVRPMSATATVNGIAAEAVVSGGVARVTSPVLANDRLASVAVTVTDAAGNKTSTSWSFEVEVYPPVAGGVIGNCLTCHPSAATSNDMLLECDVCHTGVQNYPHQGDPVTFHTPAPLAEACRACHVSSLLSEHGRHTDSAGAAFACTTCHTSADPAVVSAIESGDSDCDACHDPHATEVEDHTATPAAETIRISGVDFADRVCAECHLLVLGDEHAKTTSSSGAAACSACHSSPRNTLSPAWAKGCVQGGCHSAGSSAPKHASIDATHAIRAENAGCLGSGCHDALATKPFAGKSLAEIHSSATTTVAGQTRASCAVCHAEGIPATGDCVDCHPERALSHGYTAAVHMASSTQTIAISSVDFRADCSLCHTSFELGPIHSSACSNCHTTLVTALGADGGWGKNCAQADCHAVGSTRPQHAGIDTSHTISPNRTDCQASGCHDAGAMTPFAGKSVAEIHSAATTTVAGQQRTSCAVCHAAGVVPSTDCLDCHPERASSHGYDSAKHTTDESCLLSCHTTELKPAHEAEVTTKITVCADCHPTLVTSVTPWDGTCAGCHPTVTPATHLTPGQTHAGTDAAMLAYSAAHYASNPYGSPVRYTHGCTSNPTAFQFGCHDLSSLSALHGDLPGKGCSICHDPSRTAPAGANECLTCHQIGYTTAPYSEDTTVRTVDLVPASDISGSATLTRVGGSTNYGTQLTNDGNTSTLQFTTLGNVLFGYSQASALPTNAVVSSVRVYFTARKASSTVGTSRMNGSLNVGGTDYNTASGSLPVYGAGITFTEYSSSIYSTNPKTPGVAWDVRDINDPSRPNGLRAIGVNQNTNTAANIIITRVRAVVTYTTRTYLPTPPVGTKVYHELGRWLLNEPSLDATPGQRWFNGTPPHGWYFVLYKQSCLDRCHPWGNSQAYANYTPDFTANQGTWMWYSVGGDHNESPPERRLTSKSITLPTGTPILTFDTNYRLNDTGTGGADNAYVEVSTDGGANWANLSGTFPAGFTGNASGWVPASYDLSPYAGSDVKLRFRYVNGATSSAAGWGIDSIKVMNGSTVVYEDYAETVNDDWDNYHWTRARAAYPAWRYLF